MGGVRVTVSPLHPPYPNAQTDRQHSRLSAPGVVMDNNIYKKYGSGHGVDGICTDGHLQRDQGPRNLLLRQISHVSYVTSCIGERHIHLHAARGVLGPHAIFQSVPPVSQRVDITTISTTPKGTHHQGVSVPLALPPALHNTIPTTNRQD